MQTILEKIETLATRLHEGYGVVERGLKAGEPPEVIERWEDFWIGLLVEYESLCRKARGLE